jgi:hypothetical protein
MLIPAGECGRNRRSGRNQKGLLGQALQEQRIADYERALPPQRYNPEARILHLGRQGNHFK